MVKKIDPVFRDVNAKCACMNPSLELCHARCPEPWSFKRSWSTHARTVHCLTLSNFSTIPACGTCHWQVAGLMRSGLRSEYRQDQRHSHSTVKQVEAQRNVGQRTSLVHLMASTLGYMLNRPIEKVQAQHAAIGQPILPAQETLNPQCLWLQPVSKTFDSHQTTTHLGAAFRMMFAFS